MDTILEPLATGANEAITDVVTLGVPVLVVLIGLGVGLRIFGKFGIKR